MTERRFEYDERLLEQCALSPLSRFVASSNPKKQEDSLSSSSSLVVGDDSSCLTLFEQHQLHYGRTRPQLERAEPQESFFWQQQFRSPHDSPQQQHLRRDDRPGVVYERLDDGSYSVGRRFQAFVQNVRFVYQHNQEDGNDYDVRHQVALNRFSDMFLDEIFPGAKNGGVEEASDDLMWAKSLMEHDVPVTHLNDVDSILSVATESSFHLEDVEQDVLGIGKGSMNHLNPKKYQTIYRDSKVLTLPPADISPEKFTTPNIEQDGNGAILSVKPHRKRQPNIDFDTSVPADSDSSSTLNRYHPAPSSTSSSSPPPPPATGGAGGGGAEEGQVVPALDDVPHEEIDDYARHLNWATTENPDGVSIVNPAFDQGACGACWAFATTGSLEASAARREAYNAFRSYTKRHPNIYQDGSNHNVTSLELAAASHAQQVERESASLLNLSIQELVDCDTGGDQGCTGGNPVLSFYFIHRYGLTSWTKYPYVAKEEMCRVSLVKQPIATVKSWGVISPNHENHMELVLRYIGPIAVGVNGASASFLAYSGGIYDNPLCRQGPNHALLITGYGEERADDGSVVRFWHARNSWGTGWGENGYVRVKRGDGKKGSLGVCGIARSASVALGGVLLPISRKGEGILPNNSETNMGVLAPHGPLERLCFMVGMQSNSACLNSANWVAEHKALSLGMFSIVLGAIAAMMLTRDCRMRGRRRARQLRRRREEQERLNESCNRLDGADSEGSPLLLGSEAPGSNKYGSGAQESRLHE